MRSRWNLFSVGPVEKQVFLHSELPRGERFRFQTWWPFFLHRRLQSKSPAVRFPAGARLLIQDRKPQTLKFFSPQNDSADVLQTSPWNVCILSMERLWFEGTGSPLSQSWTGRAPPAVSSAERSLVSEVLPSFILGTHIPGHLISGAVITVCVRCQGTDAAPSGLLTCRYRSCHPYGLGLLYNLFWR